MTAENFVYWLRGFLELSAAGFDDPEVTLYAPQIKMINEHLDLVMEKKTPVHQGPVFREPHSWSTVVPDPNSEIRVTCDAPPPRRALSCSLPSQEIGFRSIYTPGTTRYCT